MKSTLLVMGATGTVGQEVIKALLAKGAKVKVGLRDITKIQHAPWINEVEVAILDYQQPETLTNALHNIKKLFLVTPPGIYQEQEIAASILFHGKKAGLQHIVRLSGLGAEDHNLFANHAAADALLLSSGLAYSILRPNIFMQNFYNYLTSIRTQHTINEPAGNGKASFIDARDIAAVAATLLTETGHENKIYELTGGEALDYQQVANLFTEILGYPITYQPLIEKEYIQANEAAGIPANFSAQFIKFFQRVQQGEYAAISPMVEKILGRAPITFKQFILDQKNKFLLKATGS